MHRRAELAGTVDADREVDMVPEDLEADIGRVDTGLTVLDEEDIPAQGPAEVDNSRTIVVVEEEGEVDHVEDIHSPAAAFAHEEDPPVVLDHKVVEEDSSFL